MKCYSCKKQIEKENLAVVGLRTIHKNCYDNFIRNTVKEVRKNRKKASESIKDSSLQQEKSRAKQTAWRAFSKYIRLRDSVDGMCECISCGVTMKAMGGKYGAQAGHFIPKSKGEYFYFNEDNVHSQCKNCNEYGSHDTGALYRYRLIKKIGKEKVEELESMKGARIEKPTLEDYRKLAKKYNNLVKVYEKK